VAVEQARRALGPELTAEAVVGALPNIPANRINVQLDLAGPGHTVSAEQASGVVALEIAARALREGELDVAIVGAVDLSHEPVHRAALAELGLPRPAPRMVLVQWLIIKGGSRTRGGARGSTWIAVLGEAPRRRRSVSCFGDGAFDPFLIVAAGRRMRRRGCCMSRRRRGVCITGRGRSSGKVMPWLGERVARRRGRRCSAGRNDSR
jgi:hypothetical protein